MPKQPTESPISIRLHADVRNAVAAWASEQEIAFNRAVGQLLEHGLEHVGKPIPRENGEAEPEKRKRKATKPSAEKIAKLTKPKNVGISLTVNGHDDLHRQPKAKPAKEKPEKQSKSAPSAVCEHRVPLSSFCSKCAGLTF